MCILFIFVDPCAKPGQYRMIIASNRDEYYNRPAQTVQEPSEDGIVGGKDMLKGVEGGMWFGASINQLNDHKVRVGALLNLTGEERKSGVTGRGPIVSNYLATNKSLDDYIQLLQSPGLPYNAFNFVAVELSETDASVAHYCNRSDTKSVAEGRQVLAFGNSTFESPLVKVVEGRKLFEEIIRNHGSVGHREQLEEQLLGLLKLQKRHLPDDELKRRAPSAYEMLSSIYVEIVQAGYGTRTHTILLVDYDWNFEFIESTMKEPITDPQNPLWVYQSIKSRL